MENAAKALLIAGGILIAIMILTVLVYAITTKNRIEKAEYEKVQLEKIAKFNSEFEAYNKNRLYGIDVISVINKAIAHNKKMQATKTEDKYFINVVFVTNGDQIFTNSVVKIDNISKDEDTITNPADLPAEWQGIVVLGDGTDLPVGENNLGTFTQNGKEFVTNLNFKKAFDGSMQDLTLTTDYGKTTYKLYSALTNFKKAIFCCTGGNLDSNGDILNEESSGVTYGNNGTIKQIRFVQVKTTK